MWMDRSGRATALSIGFWVVQLDTEFRQLEHPEFSMHPCSSALHVSKVKNVSLTYVLRVRCAGQAFTRAQSVPILVLLVRKILFPSYQGTKIYQGVSCAPRTLVQ